MWWRQERWWACRVWRMILEMPGNYGGPLENKFSHQPDSIHVRCILLEKKNYFNTFFFWTLIILILLNKTYRTDSNYVFMYNYQISISVSSMCYIHVHILKCPKDIIHFYHILFQLLLLFSFLFKTWLSQSLRIATFSPLKPCIDVLCCVCIKSYSTVSEVICVLYLIRTRVNVSLLARRKEKIIPRVWNAA